jgi:hypothetical protein
MGSRKNRKHGAGSARGQVDTKSYRQASYTCEAHGKRTWPDRKDARKVTKTMRYGGESATGLREYRCDVTGHWHIGHLPPDVVHGVVSMAEAKATMDRRDRKIAKQRTREQAS